MEPTLPLADAPHRHPIEFTATGSEYFRIWIVNLLLTLVTLGLYLPWARVRKFQYFYRNTWVAGDALDFHGNPLRMLRGTMIAAVMLAAYSISGRFAGWIALVTTLAIIGLWPALFRAAMRFRLANTSWRGLRFHFTGGLAGAYACMLPPIALLLLPGAIAGALLAIESDSLETLLSSQFKLVSGLIGLMYLGLAVLLPYFLLRIRRYQHDNYNFGDQRMQLKVDAGPLYGVFIRALGIGFLSGAVIAAAIGIGVLIGTATGIGAGPAGGRAQGLLIIIPILALGSLFMNLFLKSYLQVRLQNLFWSKTGNEALRFQSHLRLAPYLWLQCKNYVLIVLTLGLYWPFAIVNTRRAQLQATELQTRIGLDQITGIAGRENPGAAGDMAADFFGFDIGI
jgi:uncharacterized membrane protein YjgN (DUF898 family)